MSKKNKKTSDKTSEKIAAKSAPAKSTPVRINRNILIALALIAPLIILWVWASALSFIPVPWPDDSAFYFVAKELFKWPPRWVMLPQAPFEPTYRIWNFNTMPLYPILIGLGRLIGIEGSHALKLWSLGFYAASTSFLGVALYRAKLPATVAAILVLVISLDPELHWGAVIVRPESLIGLCGMILVCGLSLGWFNRDPQKWYWDPISALLAIGALAHFNAVHLMFALVPFIAYRPKRAVMIGLKTLLYMSPWIFTVLIKFNLFIHQMTLQWERLAVPNGWLNSVESAVSSMYQSLGAPEAWPKDLHWTAVGIWLIIFMAIGWGILYPLGLRAYDLIQGKPLNLSPADPSQIQLAPAAGWILGSMWLWNGKPEVWFVYYIHLSVWCFAGIALLKLWLARGELPKLSNTLPLGALVTLCVATLAVFTLVDVDQASHLGATHTWNWDVYHDFVSCIDRELINIKSHVNSEGRQFTVWAPTFPDTTIELSLRHPEWDFSRTNDFSSRTQLAMQHGFESDVVVVTEMLNWPERDIDGPWANYPEIHSVWMDWKEYFLTNLYNAPKFKPFRYLCQKGRWQAFIFAN